MPQTGVTRAPTSTTQAVIDLGRLSLAFGRVDRITYHEDGVTPESDTDHTVMLGLTACALAHALVPRLNVGRIAQYALVHDLVEAYAGDTPTLRMPTAEERAEKKRREREAFNRIYDEFAGTLPWLPELIVEYEALSTPEARWVKALDKLLPKITHLLNGAVTIRKQGMNRDELIARYAAQLDELLVYAADFPELFRLRTDLLALVMLRLDQAPDVPDEPSPAYEEVFARAVTAAQEIVYGPGGGSEDIIAEALRAASGVFAASDQAYADRLIAETGLAGMDISDGSARLRLVLANELATKMTMAFRTILDANPRAVNYIEQTVTDRETGERYVFIVVKPDGETPHELRQQAEVERDWLLAEAPDELRSRFFTVRDAERRQKVGRR